MDTYICALCMCMKELNLSPEMSLSNHQIKQKQCSVMIKSTGSGLWSQKDQNSNSCCTSYMLF